MEAMIPERFARRDFTTAQAALCPLGILRNFGAWARTANLTDEPSNWVKCSSHQTSAGGFFVTKGALQLPPRTSW